MRKSNLKLLSLGLLTCSLAMNLTACKKESDIEETTQDIMDVLQETEEVETTSSTLETGVQEIQETIAGGIEVTEDESRRIDKIIEQLQEDMMREPIPVDKIDGIGERESETSEQDIIDRENKDWENSVRESLGVETEPVDSTDDIESTESSDESDTTSEGEISIENERPDVEHYDADGKENTREIQGFEEETEPIVGDDGAIIETPEYKISKAKLEGSGPRIGTNTSESMEIGSVYHYFSDDGSKLGRVGDFVMCGELAINVVPGLSEAGYDITSSGDSVTIHTNIGDIQFKLLRTSELDVHKMSASQMCRLSGLNVTEMYMNATHGTYGSYSQCLIDKPMSNGVQYYTCTFGTYEIKYTATKKGMVQYLINAAYPESSLNEVVVLE